MLEMSDDFFPIVFSSCVLELSVVVFLLVFGSYVGMLGMLHPCIHIINIGSVVC